MKAAARRVFLEALALSANVSEACRAAGVTRSVVYGFRRRCEGFAQEWEDAMQAALDGLEAALIERAMRGVEKPVYYGGKACGMVRQYSDQLAMFLLKAHRPATYGQLKAERDEGSMDGEAARAELLRRLAGLTEEAVDGDEG